MKRIKFRAKINFGNIRCIERNQFLLSQNLFIFANQECNRDSFNLMRSTYLFILLLFCASCEYKTITPSTGTPVLEYMIFGHIGSFCNKCDVLYKIENGQLYTTNHQLQIDPANVQFVILPSAKYDSVKDLVGKLPGAIYNEKSQMIGSYFPDVGHTYIEIKNSSVNQSWYIEANNIPTYLLPFLNDVSKATTFLW